jgi:tetratricopeptide (TPR) repeat protein
VIVTILILIFMAGMAGLLTQTPQDSVVDKDLSSSDTTKRNGFLGSGMDLEKTILFLVAILGGVGACVGGIAAVVALIRRRKLPLIQEVLKTSEDIVVLLEDKESKEYASVEKVVRNVERNSKASFFDKAIANAYRFQVDGRIDEALQKWRDIANHAEGHDNDLAARAWFSIGYLHNEQGREEEALSAYDKAIHLDRDYIAAYYNRGRTKRELSKSELTKGNVASAFQRYESALADYNEALRLIPDLTEDNTS